jgi:hypothetical protein
MPQAPVQPTAAEYPRGLIEWAGHRSGGVRKPFYESSGRPCKIVIETPLLLRLRQWAQELGSSPSAPRTVLLVGGPGNGKTEAVEDVLRSLDTAFKSNGKLNDDFTSHFAGGGGKTIPRLVKASLGAAGAGIGVEEVYVVQDASANDQARPKASLAELLVGDLGAFANKGSKRIYIACVNRGILDDALTFATESKNIEVQELVETVIRSVGLSPSAPSCWPLQGFEHVAVWPMDVETLISSTTGGIGQTPAEQLFQTATEVSKWPIFASCAAGDHCPFCKSRATLSKNETRAALLQILRWFELATGKRWSFRDLFSLVSYLFSATSHQAGEEADGPCEWAAKLLDLSKRPSGKNDNLRLRAPFILAGSLYEHALFCQWPKLSSRGLRNEIRELEMQGDAGLMGLHYFLSTQREVSIPSTLQPQLAALSEALDPALADPGCKLAIGSKEVLLKDIDARFSQSVGEGLALVRKWLSVLEVELLERLERTDDLLSSPLIRRRRPAAAKRMQNLVRDFSSRLVRRSLGVRYGVTREHEVLADFEKVVAGDVPLLHKAVKQVEALVNDGDRFLVVLNATFGEPLAPLPRRATVRTAKQKVKSIESPDGGRPPANVRFLSIGGKGHPLALTYELFRSVRELEAGMLPASLPRSVVALLDTTRAKLSGVVVRDEEELDGAEIRIGTRDTVISRELGEFVVLNEAKI